MENHLHLTRAKVGLENTSHLNQGFLIQPIIPSKGLFKTVSSPTIKGHNVVLTLLTAPY